MFLFTDLEDLLDQIVIIFFDHSLSDVRNNRLNNLFSLLLVAFFILILPLNRLLLFMMEIWSINSIEIVVVIELVLLHHLVIKEHILIIYLKQSRVILVTIIKVFSRLVEPYKLSERMTVIMFLLLVALFLVLLEMFELVRIETRTI